MELRRHLRRCRVRRARGRLQFGEVLVGVGGLADAVELVVHGVDGAAAGGAAGLEGLGRRLGGGPLRGPGAILLPVLAGARRPARPATRPPR